MRNAIDAMRNSLKKDLTISKELSAGGLLTVSISDTGTGIEPEIREQLFQPFVTTKAEGMGFGLSISRTIVDAHGGKLWVDDDPGGGANFRFTLPIADIVRDHTNG